MQQHDPTYTALCNSVTLQSNNQGFFLDFADHVTDTVDSEWINGKFALLRTDEERLRACYELGDCVHGVLQNVQELYRKKSAPLSAQKRREAERYLDAGDPRQALLLCNHAVIRAPPTGADPSVDEGLSLTLGLAVRSESLLQLEEHEACLSDIQLAIREGFPLHRRYELYWRMGRSYRELGQVPKARVSLQLALTLLEESKDKIGPLEAISSSVRLQNEASQLGMEQLPRQLEATPIKGPTVPTVSRGRNPDMPSASRLVTVTSSPEQGRYAVATGRIATGDTVVVEAPYAACLLPDMFGTHCHHCFVRLLAPVGCSECSGIAFCSTNCRDQAVGSYHRYECHYMDLLVGSGMSILCHLALRMLTQSGLQHFLGMKDTLQESFLQPNMHPGGYASVYNLVTHADERPAKDFMHRTLMALFLLRCLQEAHFFQTNTNNNALSPDELFIGSLIIRHLQLLQFNAHEIFETQMEAPNKFRGSKTLYVGVGIYPTVAMFNHDCHPALARYFVSKYIVLRAIRPLDTGDCVSENYGPIFTKRPLDFRQRTLCSRYWFKCSCQACTEDWPTYDTLTSDSLRLR
ncbi:SET and MYND domain-containing protein 4 isoform X2 [Zootermopsis nevadensis]|uniref:SET and MYND domain-containing protein 4 isoform X2 n=1 Tax=Zootermopsis nevadensis TaxID=136037 RepID=UPI000B8EB639|nr:SET and MYND domain-containing protein 4 isoform X2 [Zootermopsis nevadensis]